MEIMLGAKLGSWEILSRTGTDGVGLVSSVLPCISGDPAWPAVPNSPEDLGIPRDIINDLILRSLWLHGSATSTALQRTLKLPYHVLETFFHQFRQQHLVELKQTVGLSSTYGLTTAGRSQVATRAGMCQYVGPAPVSLDQYTRVVKAQTASTELTREQLRDAFDDLVLPDDLLDQLGPSLIAHQSLFLYGDTGSGKSSIAQRILRVYEDPVLIPYAVEVDGCIISVFDPNVHRLVNFSDDNLDPRWAVCQRPCVSVGGEFSVEMLELSRDEATRVFIAPSHVKANNGILIMDDFGRQKITPRELLNRWITPMDQHMDYLTLTSGAKFQMPFELMLVFATNMDPSELVDQAFLRRVQTKVRVPNVSPEDFDRIFRKVMEKEHAQSDPGCAAHLRRRCLTSGSKVLRACYPMDIFRLIKAITRYEGGQAVITTAIIDRAADLYFARSEPKDPARTPRTSAARQAGPKVIPFADISSETDETDE